MFKIGDYVEVSFKDCLVRFKIVAISTKEFYKGWYICEALKDGVISLFQGKGLQKC